MNMKLIHMKVIFSLYCISSLRADSSSGHEQYLIQQRKRTLTRSSYGQAEGF